MRKDRDRAGGPTVEFVGEDHEPAVDEVGTVDPRRVRDRALIAAGLLVAVLVLAVVGHDHGTPVAAPKAPPPASRPLVPTRAVAPPREPPLEAQIGTGFAGSPTVAITRAFATHIPGSVVISEHTRLADRGRVLDARKIRAVTGNVTLDIVVSRSRQRFRAHVTRLTQGVYAITIHSRGYYPPTLAQLRQLAADRRLTAVL